MVREELRAAHAPMLMHAPCRYILVYPQGCDVCNHLSLFLCVADYDKLLPGLWQQRRQLPMHAAGKPGHSLVGWSHFAQFTIAVVNKDPKKSKYSGEGHSQSLMRMGCRW